MKFPYLLLIFPFFYFSCSKPKADKKKTDNSTLLLKKAFDLLDKQQTKRSFLYFNKAKELFIQNEDSLRAGLCLVNMGMISVDQGDNFGGQELSLNAISFFDETDLTHYPYIRSNLNNLGIASYSLKEFAKAREFYKRTLQFSSDSSAVFVVKNNIANTFREQKDYLTAIEIYQQVLDKETDPVNYARALSNLASAKWLQNPRYNAIDELSQALNIRQNEKDIKGLNSSYSHLADYYMHKRPDSALFYSLKMYESAKALNSPDDRLMALRKLIKLSDPRTTKTYFDIYQHLEDSVQTVRAAAKNQFALIRYESEKHKANNLKLQKENAERNTWIFSLVLLMAVSGLVAVFWYRKKKERLELDSKSAIKEGQLRTSKKVHDVVANGLYRLMSEIQNGGDFGQDRILDDMETLYEQSRNISYDNENRDSVQQAFDVQIKKMLDSFNSGNTKVMTLGNTYKFWDAVGSKAKVELKYVLQELMVNMKKHSYASYVAIRFENLDNVLKIHYVDNGIGLSAEKSIGSGLRNTGNRIKSIGGDIKFGKSSEGGLKILISFPPFK